MPEDGVLVRTADGTHKMRSHASDITPKLRAVLFLIDGRQTAQALLARAGGLRALLESQLAELQRLGLVEAAGSRPALPPQAPVAAAGTWETRADIPPIVGAKMQLLSHLESIDGDAIRRHSASLVAARSWRELARRSKELSAAIQVVAGTAAASAFWSDAKHILIAWKGKEASPLRP